MDSHSHDACQHEHRTLWLHVWPFNFQYTECPYEGMIAEETGIRGWFDENFCALAIENGQFKFHTERHPWWVPFGH